MIDTTEVVIAAYIHELHDAGRSAGPSAPAGSLVYRRAGLEQEPPLVQARREEDRADQDDVEHGELELAGSARLAAGRC